MSSLQQPQLRPIPGWYRLGFQLSGRRYWRPRDEQPMERQNFVFYLFPGSVHVYFTAHSDRHKDRHGGLVLEMYSEFTRATGHKSKVYKSIGYIVIGSKHRQSCIQQRFPVSSDLRAMFGPRNCFLITERCDRQTVGLSVSLSER